jgi:hypothetical protein
LLPILYVGPAKLLYPLSSIDLRREDVSLAVDRDIVQGRELADLPSGPTEAAECLLRSTVDDAYLAVHAVDHVQLLLPVGREHEIIDRAGAARGLLVNVLGDESAVFAEYLQAVVAPVADVNETVLVDADAVNGYAELL